MNRVLVVRLLLVGLTVCILLAVVPSSTRARSVPTDAPPRTFAPDADARVEARHPTTNYGTSTLLRVDHGGDPQVASYMHFTLTDVSAPIQRATLRVYATSDTVNGPAVYATSRHWSEDDITWTNRPTPTSAASAHTRQIAAATWVEFDVTPLVVGTTSPSLLLITDTSDGLNMSSREGTHPPQLVLTLAGSGSGPPPPTPAAPVLLAAGDIASCSSSGDEATAQLLASLPGTIATLGDTVYPAGTAAEFATCYDPSWGRYKARTNPAVGNHEYRTDGAMGYFDYFGATAGDPTAGYYSYDLGSWHVLVLNSNCSHVECTVGSRQEHWLRTDLAAHPTHCTLAYWHHPRFSSGEHGNHPQMQPIWQALYEAGAEVVLTGHDHHYERFAPQDPHGTLDPTQGIRAFVVGTGGKSLYPVNTPLANSEVQNTSAFGVLQLTLHPTSYDWQFLPVPGHTFTDSGHAACH